MAIIDFVKWDASDDSYAWKFPSSELSTWTQLVVAESQEAMLVKEGQYVGPFRAGRHTLDTNNYPYLTKILKIPFGNRSPFTAEVWFVNRAIPLDVKWGTQDPIQLQDPKYDIMLPVRAFGTYGVQIDDTRKFLQKIVGTMPGFQHSQMVSYFRGMILTYAKTVISQYIVRDKTSILEISAHLKQISDVLEEQMIPVLDEFGLKLINFFVNSINTPEDDPAVRQLKAALAKRAEMSILGYTYQQERSFDMLQTAAGNEGSTQSALMGAGMGLGMGVGLGTIVAPAMSQVGATLQTGAAGLKCPKCNTMNQPAAKFCVECAESLNQAGKELMVCSACSAKTVKPSKFCSNCGRPFSCCPKCGADNPDAASACTACSSTLPVKCGKCQTLVPADARFCPNCGQSSVKQCSKCGEAVKPGVKFCANCGNATNGV
jgi:membrane protease subunit (stomatin/prohibitin family)